MPVRDIVGQIEEVASVGDPVKRKPGRPRKIPLPASVPDGQVPEGHTSVPSEVPVGTGGLPTPIREPFVKPVAPVAPIREPVVNPVAPVGTGGPPAGVIPPGSPQGDFPLPDAGPVQIPSVQAGALPISGKFAPLGLDGGGGGGYDQLWQWPYLLRRRG